MFVHLLVMFTKNGAKAMDEAIVYALPQVGKASGSCRKNGPPSTILSFSKGLWVGCGFLVRSFHMIQASINIKQQQ